MRLRASCFGVLIAWFAVGAAVAQVGPNAADDARAASVAAGASLPNASGVVPLTVQAGTPLDVALEKPVAIKHVGVPVQGRVVEPIYVFDHLVIPAGSHVLGHVSKVESASRKRRGLAIANGNFTPLRTATVDSDTLILKDGTRLPLATVVTLGAPRVVHLEAGERGKKKKKGRVGQAVTQAREEVKAREHEAVQEIKAPGKMDRVKAALASELPYRRQKFPAGTHFTAELKARLELGKETPSPEELGEIGGEIPPGSTVHVRLVTPLSSANDHKGTPVQAVVSEPVFSSNRQLILSEGARLEGSVTQAVPARRLGRNGQLRFTFHQIDLNGAAPRKVEASLQGVSAASPDQLEVDSEGGAHAVTPKTKYIAPAIQVMLAVLLSTVSTLIIVIALKMGWDHRAPTWRAAPSAARRDSRWSARRSACSPTGGPLAPVSRFMARAGRCIPTSPRAAGTRSSPRTLLWKFALGPMQARLPPLPANRRLRGLKEEDSRQATETDCRLTPSCFSYR